MSDCCAFYRGKVKFSSGGNVWRDFGNASKLLLTPVIDEMIPLDANLNDTCCSWISCGVELTFSCMDAKNLSMALSSNFSSSQATTIHNAGQSCMTRGAIKFEGMNQFGGQIIVDVPDVEFRPTDIFNLISSEIEQITLTGRVRLVRSMDNTWFKVTTTSSAVAC